MPRERVAEHRIVGGAAGGRRLRVDLHGVSVFGPGDARTLIRWERIRSIEADEGGVTVVAAGDELTFPPGAFGLDPQELAGRLERGRSIMERPDVIGNLVHD